MLDLPHKATFQWQMHIVLKEKSLQYAWIDKNF